ncbi:MAG: PAS domain-containing protein [Sedimentisphaerales bacterium]|nr:PAS domain-containing protein [Sedimentisphaerales bacterium]
MTDAKRTTKTEPAKAKPAPKARSGAAKTGPPVGIDGKRFPIVGIGASAGGLDAVQQLRKHLPAQTGMAFVLVQHLDPTHESALTSILARATDVPVGEVKHDTPVEAEEGVPAEEDAFDKVLGLLRQQTNVDFTHYKHATLRRRIHRRMVLHKHQTLKDYVEYLHKHPAEIKELYNDILIHVTGFFRDAAMFRVLKSRVFPRLVKGRPPEETLRLWVPGCSTGEEVYSLAIALLEFLSDRKLHHTVQIFGTDISDTALERARAGLYPDSIKGDVSSERLRRFFVKTEQGFRINESVREMCIFARQNVAVAPPFSNLDLISCRNVLIYLGAVLQRKVMPLFHYALRPDGFLVLGASETVGGFGDLFELLDRKSKVYVKKAVQGRPVVSFGRGISLPYEIPDHGGETRAPTSPSMIDIQKQADRVLLAHYSPAGVIINKHMEVLQFRGKTGAYLEHAHGEASLHLLKMAREGLVLDLRTAITKAVETAGCARQEGVHVRQNGGVLQVNLEVMPFTVPPSQEQFYMVLFEPVAAPSLAPEPTKKAGKQAAARQSAQERELARVREELAATREPLQATIEEQEATNEELRSADEEIMSSNEELQSTNEELATLNDELESRNNDLAHVNNDLHDLLASVNIAVVMVGADLRIRRFTSMAEQVLNLIPADVGRPITDINLPIERPRLSETIAEVIDGPTTSEVDVKSKKGKWWSVCIRPYKTTDHKIDGAVIALLDIDALKRGTQQVFEDRHFAEALFNTAREPLLALDAKLVVQFANPIFFRTFRVSAGQTLGRRLYDLGNGQWNIPKLRTLLEEVLAQNSSFEGFEVEHDFPDLGRKKMLLNARRPLHSDDDYEPILLAIEDVTPPTS